MAKRKAPQAGVSGQEAGPPLADALPAKKLSLNWNQERFVEEYCRHGNGTLAYGNAYTTSSPSSRRACASQLLTKPNICEAITARRVADQQLLGFKREDALRILVGMAISSLDDFTPLFKDGADRKNYKGLGYKRHALESVKKTVITAEDGSTKEINEIKIISPGERKAVINELWEKLGLGEGSSKGNWFDGFERLAELVRETTKGK